MKLPTYSFMSVIHSILNASRMTGLDRSFLISVAKIESNLNPKAINGASKGLFQMQKLAWDEVASQYGLPSYSKNWHNPKWNAIAGAAYMLKNLQGLQRLGLEAASRPSWVYLSHQQGLAGAAELIRTCELGEELPPNPKVTVQAMLRNPAPGGVKTADRCLFYRQWMRYLETVFADSD
jgi:hypothetical protein